MARITIDDKTGHIMSLEYTKHQSEKDVYRNWHSVRAIRTLLLHCSFVTPKQQPKTVLKGGLSDCSDRSGVTSKELFKFHILSAVSLDDVAIDPWMQASRSGRFC